MARSTKPKNKPKAKAKASAQAQEPQINPEILEKLNTTFTNEVEPTISAKAELIAQKLPHIKSKITQIQLIHYLNFFLYKDAVSLVYKPLIKTYADLYNLTVDLEDEQTLKTWFDQNLGNMFDIKEIQNSSSYQWLLSYLTIGNIFLGSPNLLAKLKQFYNVTSFEECLEVITSAMPFYSEFLDSIITNLDKEISDNFYTEKATKITKEMDIIVKSKEQSHLDFPDVNEYVIANNEYEKASTLIQVIRYVFNNVR